MTYIYFRKGLEINEENHIGVLSEADSVFEKSIHADNTADNLCMCGCDVSGNCG